MDSKTRFLLDKDKSARWADIAASLLFAEACDVAMLEMADNFSPGGGFDINAANELRRQGAKQVVGYLKTLCKLPEAPPPRVSDNLPGV